MGSSVAARLGLLTLFGLSGAAGLALEVVWMRRLHLLFGGTALAVAAVTAAFMAGLGIGSVLAGTRGDRSARPLWWYGVLEIGIAVYALAIPLLLALALPVYALFGGWFAGMPLVLDGVRFALAFAVLAPATTAMGATLPLLVRHLSASGNVGLNTGALYAANTFGALIGVCLAGYVLLPGIGESATTWLAASIDAAVGAGALLWARRTPLLAAAPPDDPAAAAAPPHHRLILVVVGVTGFASLACQVAWTRLIAMLLGSSVYAFTCIVAAVLAGISVGSVVSRHLPERWARGRTGALACTTLLGALAVLAGSACVNRLPWTVYDLVLWAGPDGYWLVQLAIASVLILPAAICFGAAPPLAIRALAPDPQRASRWVGRTWAANTVGALLGAGLGGLLLLPTLGMQATLSVAAGLATAVAVAAVRRETRGAAWAVAGAVAAMLLWGVTPGWSPNLLVSQPYVLASEVAAEADAYASAHAYAKHQSDALQQPLFHVEGNSATVSVMENSFHLLLQVDGKPDASSVGDMDTQLLLAHIPMLLHPQPARVMVIGLGSGVTVGSASLHPGSHVTAVEIEPAVARAAAWFSHVNHHVLERDNVEIVIEDARTLLLTDHRPWDVVISEPSNPWLSGPAKLFTREFFTMVQGRLAPDGVFGQWIHVYGLELPHLQAIVRTFQTVFPDVRMFVTIDQADLLLVGGSGVAPIDWADMERRAADPAIAAELIGTGSAGAAGICSRYLAGPNECLGWAGTGPLNTDDNGLVEYGAGWRGWQKGAGDEMINALETLDPDASLLVGPGAGDWPCERMLGAMAEAAAARNDGPRAIRFAQAGLRIRDTGAGHRALGIARLAGVAGLDAEASLRRALALDAGDGTARVALAGQLFGSGDYAEALEVLGTPPPDDFAGTALRAAALAATGESVRAHALFATLPPSAWDDRDVSYFEWGGRAALGANAPGAAAMLFEAQLARYPVSPRTWTLLVRALRESGATDRADRLAKELEGAEAFSQRREAELKALYNGGAVSLEFLRAGAERQSFDPYLAAELLPRLRLHAWGESGAARDALLAELLQRGRTALARHPGAYRLAIEHAYSCAWLARQRPEADRPALLAEAATTLRTMLALRAHLTAESRRELVGRAARYDRQSRGE